jgi:hypothetical protein
MDWNALIIAAEITACVGGIPVLAYFAGRAVIRWFYRAPPCPQVEMSEAEADARFVTHIQRGNIHFDF